MILASHVEPATFGGRLAIDLKQPKSDPTVESTQAAGQHALRKPGRPFGVTLLGLGVLILTWANLNRFVLALQQWEFLSTLLPFSPLYQAATGLVWSLAGVPLVWGLWQGKPWAPGFIRRTSLAYVAYIWLEKLLVVQHPGKTTNLPFTIVLHLLVLMFIFWLFSRANVKAFFGAGHD